MKVNAVKTGAFFLLLIFGLIIMWSGFSGRFGLALAAILTPEYLTVEGSNGG